MRGRDCGGVGWGQAKELASRCARVCQSYPLANYPLVPSRPNRPSLTIKTLQDRELLRRSVGIPPTPDRGPNPHFLEKRVSGS